MTLHLAQYKLHLGSLHSNLTFLLLCKKRTFCILLILLFACTHIVLLIFYWHLLLTDPRVMLSLSLHLVIQLTRPKLHAHTNWIQRSSTQSVVYQRFCFCSILSRHVILLTMSIGFFITTEFWIPYYTCGKCHIFYRCKPKYDFLAAYITMSCVLIKICI